MQPTVQPLTQEFVFTQIRIWLIAVVAYAGGADYFTPAGTTLALATIASILPILIPIAFSTIASWGVTKVPLNLRINAHDVMIAKEQTGDMASAPIAAVIEAAKKSSAAFTLLLAIGLLLGACASTPASQSRIQAVQDNAAAYCAYIPTAETVAAIFKTDIADVATIAKGICNAIAALPRSKSYSLRAALPTYRGVIIRGRHV